MEKLLKIRVYNLTPNAFGNVLQIVREAGGQMRGLTSCGGKMEIWFVFLNAENKDIEAAASLALDEVNGQFEIE
jgi:hypothetical protein